MRPTLIKLLNRYSFIFVAITALILSACGDSSTPTATTVKPDLTYNNVSANPDINAEVMKALKWRNIGPFRGGRSVAVAGHPSDKFLGYMGTTGGGVYKTTDAGYSWSNVSDGFFNTGSVGAIAVADSDPNIVYVGMGEHTLRGNTAPGDGVYKSTDAGVTWENVGLKDSYHIGQIAVHPTNPNVLFVAAMGHAFGPNEERGVFKSTDGGQSWRKVLYVSEDAGAVNIQMNKRNPNILYAATFEIRRQPWAIRSGGEGSGIYKSTNGGESWTNITLNDGLPTGKYRGRIGLALSQANTNRIWAIIEGEDNQTGVYRSDNAGASWQLLSQRADLSQRPWYYHHISADPVDANTVYVLNIGMWKSTDGGTTYTRVSTPHGDNHDLWIDPTDNNHWVQANDGGGTVTFNGGKSWSTIYNQSTAQIYRIWVDNKYPYRIYSNQQDNTSISIPSRSDFGMIYPQEYYNVGGGESGYLAFDKDDPNVFFAGEHHWMMRFDIRNNTRKEISLSPEDNYGYGSADLPLRVQWTYPIILSKYDKKTLYAGSQFVHKSTDEGQTWEIISPDLTRHDSVTLEKTPTIDNPEVGSDWGPIKRDNTGVEWYATVFALDESPIKQGLLWTGSDDGYIHVSQDGGSNWENVTPDNEDFNLLRVCVVEPSAHDPGTMYVAGTKYRQDDFSPYLYKTTDYGKTWNKITNGIPGNHYTRMIREDPNRPGLLYAGTEFGLYVSFNDGENWESLQLNLPQTPIHDLQVNQNDLVAATHGRGIWILDDLTVLHQLSDEMQKKPVHLFTPRATVRSNTSGRPAIRPVQNPPVELGENPPNGVMIHYYFDEEPGGEVEITFYDKAGEMINSYSSKTQEELEGANDEMRSGRSSGKKEVLVPAEKGGNRFVWADMRYPGPIELENNTHHGQDIGPLAPPGTYEVRMTVNDKVYKANFDIVKDPRVDLTQADYEEQFSMVNNVNKDINRLRTAVIEIRGIREQVETASATVAEGSDKAVAAAAIKDQLLRIEDAIAQFRAGAYQDLTNYPVKIHSKLLMLNNFVESADGKPTKASYELHTRLQGELDVQIQKLEELKQRIKDEYADEFPEINIETANQAI